MGGGNNNSRNPFEGVSTAHPFGGSYAGDMIGEGFGGAGGPGQNSAEGIQKTVGDIKTMSDQAQAERDRVHALAQRGIADTALRAGRQSESDEFTKGMGAARNNLGLSQSLQGMQDAARKARGRSLFQY